MYAVFSSFSRRSVLFKPSFEKIFLRLMVGVQFLFFDLPNSLLYSVRTVLHSSEILLHLLNNRYAHMYLPFASIHCN